MSTIAAPFQHDSMDWPRLGAFAFCGLILHAGFAFAGWALPLAELIEPLPEAKKEKILEERRLAILSVEELVELAPMPEEEMPAGDTADAGGRAKGDEGAMGAPVEPANNRYAVKGPADDTLAKLASLEAAQTAGILGALSSSEGSLTQVLGTRGTEDVLSSRGNLLGDEIGEAYGVGGVAISGTGRGGGGTGEGLGSIGTGRYGALGHGAGTGTGYGVGGGRGGLASVSGPPPGIRLMVSVSGSSLERADAQRAVRRNLTRMRSCYDRALTTNPDLAGKIVLELSVGATGSVGSTHVVVPEDKRGDATTIDDGALQSCVSSAVRTVTFPESDGATVTVTLILSPPPKPEPAPDAGADAKAPDAKPDDSAKAKPEDAPKDPPPPPHDPTAP